MTLQNVSIVLSPTMQISHRVLNVFFAYSKVLFRDTVIKRYRRFVVTACVKIVLLLKIVIGFHSHVCSLVNAFVHVSCHLSMSVFII